MNSSIKSVTRVRYDLVGDIAIIRNQTQKNQIDIAKKIIEKNKRIKVVLMQSEAVQGIFRLCKFKIVIGEERTTTIHHENGCIFHIDLGTAHFSPRLVYERKLLANNIESNENILNMFGGIGSFSIEIAKTKTSVKIFSIDINPEAIRFCLKNIQINHVRGKVTAVLSDAKVATNMLFLNRMNRAILPLPDKSREYFEIAILALKNQGIIHYYDFIDASKNESPLEKATSRIKILTEKNHITLSNGRIVKSVAPRRYLVSLEFLKKYSIAKESRF